MFATRTKQRGQGMTEYIIIVALIAIAAIGIYGFFGDAIRSQMGIMTEELAGVDNSATAARDAAAASGAAEGAVIKDLGSFED